MNEFPAEVPGQPYGHIPGVHLPGTLIPIGAVVAQQQAEREQAEEAERKRRRQRANLLLTIG